MKTSNCKNLYRYASFTNVHALPTHQNRASDASFKTDGASDPMRSNFSEISKLLARRRKCCLGGALRIPRARLHHHRASPPASLPRLTDGGLGKELAATSSNITVTCFFRTGLYLNFFYKNQCRIKISKNRNNGKSTLMIETMLLLTWEIVHSVHSSEVSLLACWAIHSISFSFILATDLPDTDIHFSDRLAINSIFPLINAYILGTQLQTSLLQYSSSL